MDLKRAYERIEIELPCRLFIPGTGKSPEPKFEAFAISRNLSLGGVFVESSFLLKTGIDLVVEITLPNEKLPVKGRVVHSIPLDHSQYSSGMGIQFFEVNARGREVLLRFFAPDNYRQFYQSMVEEFSHLGRELGFADVSLVLNLWEEWKVRQMGGPAGTDSGAPEAAPIRKARRR